MTELDKCPECDGVIGNAAACNSACKGAKALIAMQAAQLGAERGARTQDEQIAELRDVLRRHGFVECDIPACNCGSWHARYGLPERMNEIREALTDAGHPPCNDNGNLILVALRELIAERAAREAVPHSDVHHKWSGAFPHLYPAAVPTESAAAQDTKPQAASEAPVPSAPAAAPGHTDLMISPEGIDEVLAADEQALRIWMDMQKSGLHRPEEFARRLCAEQGKQQPVAWIADELERMALLPAIEAEKLSADARFGRAMRMRLGDFVEHLRAAPTPDALLAAELAGMEKSAKTGITLINAERLRQVSQEGWTPEHDDEHDAGELAAAAAAYAMNAADQLHPYSQGDGDNLQPIIWPWDSAWWKPMDPLRDLVRAGALIAAEIDKLMRADAKAFRAEIARREGK